MARKLTNIDKAIRNLLDEYSRAKESDCVIKPISYALYQTWRIWDAKEKPRAEGENKNDSV